MEKPVAVENSHTLYGLSRNTSPRKPSLSEVIRNSDGTLAYPHEHGLSRWTEHIREQFVWLTAEYGIRAPKYALVEPMQMDTIPPSEM